jgi:hypothetical protein
VFGIEQKRITWVLSTQMVQPIVSTRILQFENAYQAHTSIILATTGYIDCGNPTALTVAVSNLSVIFNGCFSDLPNVESYV